MDFNAGGQCVAPGTGFPRARLRPLHSGAHQMVEDAAICICKLLRAAALLTSCAAPPLFKSHAVPTRTSFR